MKKYIAVFLLNWQEALERRASFVMERVRSLALVLSLYFLWASVIPDPQKSFLGYTRAQMLTYVLGLSILRALVLTNRAFELTYEIARGRVSAHLLRPFSLFAYQFSLDLSDKAVRVLSAILEVSVLAFAFQAVFYIPQDISILVLALLSVALAVILYFFIGLTLASSGFWSGESIGFLWAASLLIEFCSGAFFPLDVLPSKINQALHLLPFPYLVYFPLNIYLERLSSIQILNGLALQIAWIIAFVVFTRQLWKIGLQNYQAEGG